MMRGKVWTAVILSALMGLVCVGTAISQDATSQPAGARGGRGGGPRMTPEEMRAQMEQRMKTALDVKDDEWTALQPKIEKVMTAQRENRGGGMMRMGRGGPGGPGGQGGPGAGADATRQQSDVELKAAELAKVVGDKDAQAPQIKAALEAYRAARAKARESLESAQKELKELLTPRQEAVLVSYGMLD
jgi:hypothetical protein